MGRVRHGLRGRAHALLGALVLVILVASCGGGGWRASLSSSARTENAEAAQKAPVGPEDIPRLIEDLRSDDVYRNAKFARINLEGLGADSVTALEGALDSDDYQQRQHAAAALRTLVESLKINPVHRLLEVTVEGLRDDDFLCSWISPSAFEAYRFLDNHFAEAAGCIIDALGSHDRQQRFISAYLMAMHRMEERVFEVSSILIEHLAHNGIRNDATMSSQALRRLGTRTLPVLRSYRNSTDSQQRGAARLIIFDIERPLKTETDLRARATLAREATGLGFAFGTTEFIDLGNDVKDRLFLGCWNGDKGPVPCLDELRKAHPEKLIWKIDRKDLRLIQVAVGLRKALLFERLLTLRVYADGTMDRRVADGDGGTRWKLVYAP